MIANIFYWIALLLFLGAILLRVTMGDYEAPYYMALVAYTLLNIGFLIKERE